MYNIKIYNDKIWLINWYKDINVDGQPYLYYSYENNIADIKNILDNIKDKSYCIKPSHLSDHVGVFVVKNNMHDLQECYLILRSVYKRAKLPIPSFSYFENLYLNANNNCGLKMFCAENQGKIIG